MDGNVLLHEWNYQKGEEPKTSVNDLGEVYLEKQETIHNLVTWVYDTDNYNPSAKIIGEETYSIVNDYLGTPVQAYNDNGTLIWERDLDVYGKIRKLEGDKDLIPFLYQGQYYDKDIELAYNRFRYYNPETGMYLSQDPIRIDGNNPTFYGYVHDSNTWIDPFGLSSIPTFDALKDMAQNTLDFSTTKDGAVFWSGPNMKNAQNWAKLNGKTTLEQTVGGKYLNDLQLFDNMPGHQAAEIWDIASKRFADGASGDINVFSTGAKRFGPFGERTWWRIEKPALLKNKNVKNIFRRNKSGGKTKNGHIKCK